MYFCHTSVECLPFGRCWAKLGRCLHTKTADAKVCVPGGLCVTSAKLGSNSVNCALGSAEARSRPVASLVLLLFLVNSGPISDRLAQFGSIWVRVSPTRPDLARDRRHLVDFG